MLPLLPLPQTLALSIAVVSLIAVLVALLGSGAGRRRAGPALLGATLLLLGAAFFGWSRGHALGVTVAWTLIPVLAAVLLALVPAVAIHKGLRLVERRALRSAPAGPDLTRRALLGLPLCAGASAALGFRAAVSRAELRELALRIPALHPDLNGLRILHLSDLHLGAGLATGDLAELLDRARRVRPDLVVLTGDVADKLESLNEALPVLEAFAPRFGTYAVLGNHEYLSGVLEQMIAAYSKSRVTLLVNEARVLDVGKARLLLVGIDDPFGKSERDFFERCLAESNPRAAADYSVLLSHRPEALDAAASRGVDLVLSGHTHGGQIGWWGRSIFERLGVARRMWGFYRAGTSCLYTSAGAGDWFPFRLNCPREAPIITLLSDNHIEEAT